MIDPATFAAALARSRTLARKLEIIERFMQSLRDDPYVPYRVQEVAHQFCAELAELT